jgi:predicted AAA+ superfamily ATPase
MFIEYKKRIADSILADKLSYMGAVLVRGPKWCGKTTTCEQVAKSAIYMDDPELMAQNRDYAAINVKDLLRGSSPRLIDEWQLAPQFWDAVRFEVDHAHGFGRFILTGSSVPPETDVNAKPEIRKVHHSGTGRIAKMTMRTMSLFESGESSGTVSVGALLRGEDFLGAEAKPMRLEDMAFLACRGGWPVAAAINSRRTALRYAREYYVAVTESDVSRVDGVPRDPERVRKLMRSYARLQGTQAKIGAIRDDMLAHDSGDMGENAIREYLNALRRIFVVEDLQAWSPSLRSKSAIRTSDTRYFVDPSIAAVSLGAKPEDLLADLRTFGFIFETLAIRDLRVYADAAGGEVRHYLDRNGLECDAVISDEDGNYGLVEIKLGGEALIDKGAAALNKLALKIDTDRMKGPAFKMVLTSVGDYAYSRKDGIIVCPIGALRQ